jgi:hypothetical protein
LSHLKSNRLKYANLQFFLAYAYETRSFALREEQAGGAEEEEEKQTFEFCVLRNSILIINIG